MERFKGDFPDSFTVKRLGKTTIKQKTKIKPKITMNAIQIKGVRRMEDSKEDTKDAERIIIMMDDHVGNEKR